MVVKLISRMKSQESITVKIIVTNAGGRGWLTVRAGMPLAADAVSAATAAAAASPGVCLVPLAAAAAAPWDVPLAAAEGVVGVSWPSRPMRKERA